jgi:hypothetical protein
MVFADEDDPESHPYWYARVLGVFHANVLHISPQATNRSVQRFEFLWVRWFGVEPGYRSGFRQARLPMIGFLPESDPLAFGFLDPSFVIRGCHLLPTFKNGRTSNYLTANVSAGRPIGEVDDWTNFYVDMYAFAFALFPSLATFIWVFLARFLDRDMFMRYFGNGIGHQFAKQTINGEDMLLDAGEQAEEGSGEGGGENTEDDIQHQDLDTSALEGEHSDDGSQDSGLSESDSGSDGNSGLSDSDDEDSTPVIDFGPEDDNEDDEDDWYGSL